MIIVTKPNSEVFEEFKLADGIALNTVTLAIEAALEKLRLCPCAKCGTWVNDCDVFEHDLDLFCSKCKGAVKTNDGKPVRPADHIF